MPNPHDGLIEAARRTHRAYLDYGPVDDGRPEGDEFEAALDALMVASVEAAAAMKHGTSLEALEKKLLSIHEPLTGEGYPEDRNRYCAVCISGDGGSSRWPCGTVRALRKLLKE